MIEIRTDATGTRHYKVPRALVAVAEELFPGREQVDAVFALARRLLCSDFAAAENLALTGEHEEAVRFARERLIERWPSARSAALN